MSKNQEGFTGQARSFRLLPSVNEVGKLLEKIDLPIAGSSNGVHCVVVPIVFSLALLAASVDIHDIPQFDYETYEFGCATPSCFALVFGIEI